MNATRGFGLALLMVVAACAAGSDAPVTIGDTASPRIERDVKVTEGPGTLRLLFVGDIMLGRGIASVVEHDPEGMFAAVRFVVRQADFAVANLESPLTVRPHVRADVVALEAEPAAAALLAVAGFDAVGIANNHAGDAGPESVTDTVDALRAAGIAVLGGGRSQEDARRALVVDRGGIRVAYLAFDATGRGMVAGAGPGVALWEAGAAEAAVAGARAEADIVVVGLHGGIEYSPIPDPQLTRLGRILAGWGVDVVWGHGSHVAQPVAVVDGLAGPSLVAASLGNFLFDQGRADTETGSVLEVVVDRSGVLAYRTGVTDHSDGRVDFIAWDLPAGDAVLWEGAWWSPVVAPLAAAVQPAGTVDFPYGDVVDASRGDLTGDGTPELVVAYRHRFEPNPVTGLYPGFPFTDAEGRSAHLGVFRPEGDTPLWGAGTLFTAVERVVACDGAVAVAYGGLEDHVVTGTGGWTWTGFGFAIAPTLPGPGEPGCADIDGDGFAEPVIRRTGA